MGRKKTRSSGNHSASSRGDSRSRSSSPTGSPRRLSQNSGFESGVNSRSGTGPLQLATTTTTTTTTAALPPGHGMVIEDPSANDGDQETDTAASLLRTFGEAIAAAALVGLGQAPSGQQDEDEDGDRGTKRQRGAREEKERGKENEKGEKGEASASRRPRREKPKKSRPPIRGTEGGVTWIWAGNLDLTLNLPGGARTVRAPALHSESVSQIGGNLFLGGYTLVRNDGTTSFAGGFKANPREEKHTEPQYFDWLDGELHDEDLSGVEALILEINQTNTPCSQAACRREILDRIKQSNCPIANCKKKKHPPYWVVARMSAYQKYETQPPPVGLTYAQADEIRNGDEAVTLDGPGAVHRVPEAHTEKH